MKPKLNTVLFNTVRFSVGMLVVAASQAAFAQVPGAPRTAAMPAAPTVTILSASTGVLVKSQGAGAASVDLGRVSYYNGTSVPGETSQKNPGYLSISTRFALKVDCPGSAASSTVDVTVSRLAEASSHAIAIDGTKLGTVARPLVQSMPCGSTNEHRLEMEVPISTEAGAIGSDIVFLATVKQ